MTIISEDILPIMALIFDVYTVVKIISFYKVYTFSMAEKKKIKAFTIFPIVYGILGLSDLMFSAVHLSDSAE